MKIEDLKELFKEYDEAWDAQRELYSDAIKFSRLGEQWDQDVARRREDEKRPCLTENQLPSFIRQVVNDARQNSPQIKVHPVDDNADKETAEVYNGLIRNIQYTSDADQSFDTGIDNGASGGWGFWRVNIEYVSPESFNQELCIERIINPNSVYPDPYSVSADGDDWNGCFVTEKVSEAEFKRRYPDKDCVDVSGDKDTMWFDEDNVRIAEFWHREENKDTLLKFADGSTMLESDYEAEVSAAYDAVKEMGGDVTRESFEDYMALVISPVVEERETVTYTVTQYIFNGNEILEENEHPGQYIPIIMVYGEEVVEDNKKIYLPMWFHAKDAQKMFNFWRTAEAEELAYNTKAPWIGPEGAFAHQKGRWDTANTKPWPYIEYGVPKGRSPQEMRPERQAPGQLAIGAHNAAQNVSNDMRVIMGMSDAALLGMSSGNQSGAAINSQKVESDTSNFHIADNQVRAINQTGRVIIDLIPHVYTGPQTVRIMGVDGKAEAVQINQVLEDGRAFNLSAGKYDLVVKAGANYTTQRKENLDNLLSMVNMDQDLARIIGDIVVQQMDMPYSDEIAQRLKTTLPPEILEMEKMEGIDDKAKGMIANLQKQLQASQEVIEQGKEFSEAQNMQIQALAQQLNDRNRELDIKEKDSERKYKADMSDTIISAITDIVEQKLETQGNAMAAVVDEIREVMREARQVSHETITDQDLMAGFEDSYQ